MAEINGNGANTPIVNYGVSSREGRIYKSSKTEEEGYTRVELSSGGVVYHKYVNGLSGKITYLTRDEKEIVGTDGKKKKLDNLKMFLSDGVTTQALGLSTYSKEWKIMIKHLYNVDFSKPVIVSFYKSKPNEQGVQYLNVSVKYEGETTEEGKDVYPEWLNTDTVSKSGVVPDPVKNGKGEWDWTDNDLWYLEKLTELTNRFIEYKKANSNEVNTPAPAPKAEAPKNAVPTATAQEAFETVDNTKSFTKDNTTTQLPF